MAANPRDINILIVDDDSAMRTGLKRLLKKSGYSITCAADGYEALLQVSKNNINLILLDLRMPKMDGLETLDRLRKDGKNIPVIIMTAFGDVKVYIEMQKLGIAEFIIKPIHGGKLKEIIKTVLSDGNNAKLSSAG